MHVSMQEDFLAVLEWSASSFCASGHWK